MSDSHTINIVDHLGKGFDDKAKKVTENEMIRIELREQRQQ